MTTAGDLVVSAFREGNLIPAGSDPTTAEKAEGLSIVNRLILSAFGFYIGSRLRDWEVPRGQRTSSVSRTYPLLPGANASLIPTYPLLPPNNARLVWGGTETSVYMPQHPLDGSCFGLVPGSGAQPHTPGTLTLDGNGRTIDGQPTVPFANLASVPVPLTYFYRADLGDWKVAEAMEWDDPSLFPEGLDDMWVCSASIRLSPRYGKDVASATGVRVKEMMTILRTMYAQSAVTQSGGPELATTDQSFTIGNGWWGNSSPWA